MRARLGVKLRQPSVQVIGARVVLDGQPVLVDGLGGVVGAPVHRDHLLVHVRHHEVVISSGLVGLLGWSHRLRRLSVLLTSPLGCRPRRELDPETALDGVR